MAKPDFIIQNGDDGIKVTVNTLGAARFMKYDWGDAGPLDDILGSTCGFMAKYVDDLKVDAAHLVIDDRR